MHPADLGKQGIHILEGPGYEGQKAFRFGRFFSLHFLIFTRCSKRSRTVSTWPNIMVPEVVMFSLCASCIISSHSCEPHFPLEIRRRTRSTRISAPAPGKLSIPASLGAVNTSRWELFSSLVICATFRGPRVCSLIVGYSDFSCLKRST